MSEITKFIRLGDAVIDKLLEQDKRIAELEGQLEDVGYCADCFRPIDACNCGGKEGE